MSSTKPLLLMILLILLLGAVSITSIIESKRASRATLTMLNEMATQQSDLRHARSSASTELGQLREQVQTLRGQVELLTSRLQHLERATAVRDTSPTSDSVGPAVSTLESHIARPFHLPADLPPETLSEMSSRKVGQLLREVSDGYVSVSLYSGREELPVSLDNIGVYKEIARLAAMQAQHKLEIVQRRRAGGEYEVFESPRDASEYVRDASVPTPGEGRRHFEVIEEDGTFLVIDVTEYYTSTLYKLTTEAEAELLHGDGRFTSSGASHHPVRERN